jgi:hypothetical protein
MIIVLFLDQRQYVFPLETMCIIIQNVRIIMRPILVIIMIILIVAGLPSRAITQVTDEEMAQDEVLDEEPLEEEEPPPEEEILPEDEEELPPEEVAPEEEVMPLPRLPFSTRRPRPPERPEVFVGESGEALDENRKVNIFADVKLNYVFAEGIESLIINYRFNIEGEVKARTAVMRGKANVKADVEGYLFKNSSAECKLSIDIPDAQYQLTFRRKDDENADLSLSFTKPILETWESRCDFTEAGAKPFITKGEPEKWLNRVLTKTSPPLNRLTATLNADEKTTTKFVINTQQINDPPLGTIEAEGSGIITVIPASAQTEE